MPPSDPPDLHALILADGTSATRSQLDHAWPGWRTGIRLVVAADGGARLAAALGVAIDRWVGDGDSLDAAHLERLRADGVEIRMARADKDESDTELALRSAIEAGARRVTLVGALGGPRLDHALANIGLLVLAGRHGVGARLVDADVRVSLIQAPGADGLPVEAVFAGRPGDLVSLLALGADVDGVTTVGLRYPLAEEPLRVGPARGLSNVRLGEEARVTVRRGLLLVVESPATLSS